jgi:hypothetical protein
MVPGFAGGFRRAALVQRRFARDSAAAMLRAVAAVLRPLQ